MLRWENGEIKKIKKSTRRGLPLCIRTPGDRRISRVVRSRGHWQWINAVAAELIESL